MKKRILAYTMEKFIRKNDREIFKKQDDIGTKSIPRYLQEFEGLFVEPNYYTKKRK